MHAVPRTPGLLLDGTWRFRSLRHPDERLSGRWVEAPVPGPSPSSSQIGVYERDFKLPRGWSRRRVVLHVGATEGDLIVEMNGRNVGTSRDQPFAAEFDVTSHVRPGTNRLRLTIVQRPDDTDLEDPDRLRHGGIGRSVFLYSTERTFLADLVVTAGLEEDLTTGTLDLLVQVGTTTAEVDDGHTVEAILAGTGVELTGRPADAQPESPSGPEPVRTGSLRMTASVPDVEPWSAEIPRLYDLHVVLRAPNRSVVDDATIRVGFRRVEVRGFDLLVNGQRVFIRGLVAGADVPGSDPPTRRDIPAEAVRDDLVLMKRFGFDAVRTSQHATDPLFLDLTDELGLYVVAEADIRSPASGAPPSDDPAHLAQQLGRVSRMVLRGRDHPSVIAWSLGSESGYGVLHEAAAAWLRRVDPTRPLHCEGAIRGDWSADQEVSDILCPSHPGIAAIVEHARSGRQRWPLIMSAYADSRGNGCGALGEHWDAIESTPGLQGGFIGDGRAVGPERRDAGPVLPDGTPKPALWEHRHLARPVRLEGSVEDAARGRITIANWQHFADLSGLRGEWQVADDGIVIAYGELPLPSLPPGGRTIVDVPRWKLPPADPSTERWLTFRTVTREASAWAPAAFEVSVDQVRIGPAASAPELVVDEQGTVELDEEGRLVHPSLARAPELSLWRAPTDNDRMAGLDVRWERLGLDRPARRLAGVVRDGASVLVDAEVRVGRSIVRHRQRFTPLEGGGIAVAEEAEIPAELDDIPRVGTVLEVASGVESVEWFGLGPHETYPDRKRGGVVGRWHAGVDELAVPYVRPQESGGRADVRWLELRDWPGTGLRIDLGAPMQVSVARHRASDLAAAARVSDLTPRREAIVNLDAAHRGVGAADTVSDWLVGPGTYRWSWSFRPLSARPA